MRRIYGLVIVGGTLIGAASGADAQVVVTPGNGLTPTQVTVGQPYLNGGNIPNAAGISPYRGGYVQGNPAGTTYYNSGYRGYRGPTNVYRGRTMVRPYYTPTQATYPRMARPRLGWRRHGHTTWYGNGYNH